MSATPKHTPGPWSADPQASGEDIIFGADGSIVAQAMGENFPANSCLIAAAPDMLAALKAAAQRANEPGNDVLAWQETVHAMHRIITAAIAKAEGAS